ncbi:MAG: ribbon-helix-helix domain-containing protein [Ancrocorticia sp.]|uniref:ribbon-helix-helix domain-containing protein n=1 Tax=Ancrocorticia sp. TaxID=2593684 RepID=UPI003F8EE647
MTSQALNISLPQELVLLIDKQAERDFASRSEYIRRAVVSQLRAEHELQAVFDRANARGSAMNITSEQQVYDIIDE